MNRSYQSNWESIGSSVEPDVLYYNASIVNNNTDDQIGGYAFEDPLIKFNETRDKAIVSDASKYQFSIVRFVVNGGNLDLPLFIPAIQSFTGQFDPNLTEYGVGLSAAIQLNDISGGALRTYQLCPPITYLEFTPENRNQDVAPVPQPPCAPRFAFQINNGIWDNTNAYSVGQIVTLDASYTLYYQAQINVPVGTSLSATYTPAATPSNPNPAPLPYWSIVSPELGRPQDVSSKYYWVSNFQTMVNMMNTALVNANTALMNALFTGWQTVPGNTAANFPYATAGVPDYNLFSAVYPVPIMSYTISNGLFSILYPAIYLNAPDGVPFPKMGLWFNANTYALFANFPHQYYNTRSGDGSLGLPLTSSTAPGPFLPGYSYKMIAQNLQNPSNVVPYTYIVPNPIQPTPAPPVPNTYVIMTQEYISTSTIWSPVESIVFISNLLPLQNEQTAPPNAYGQGNVGNSTTVAQSAFQPIITDVAQSLNNDPAGWRKMLYYSPTAEYRMADFQNSKTEIKNIDVQVFWKNRLNNQLYPMTMYNLSSVSIKIMFRKKNALMNMAKGEREGVY